MLRRKYIGLFAACAGTFLLAASAGAASAHTFSGSCVIDGQGANVPSGALVAPGYDFNGTGTCTGSVDGGPLAVHPVSNHVSAAGLSVGPLPVLNGAIGDVVFNDVLDDGTPVTLDFRFLQVTSPFLLSGDAGGNAIGYGLPNGSGTEVHVQTLSTLSG